MLELWHVKYEALFLTLRLHELDVMPNTPYILWLVMCQACSSNNYSTHDAGYWFLKAKEWKLSYFQQIKLEY